MKTSKKLSHKQFRYLTKKEFKDPLYAIADFCVNAISFHDWKDSIDLMARIACTSPKGLKRRRISDLYSYWGNLSKQIDFLYLLKHRIKDWEISKDTSFYSATFYYHSTLLHDLDLHDGTYMWFDRLKAKEIKQLDLFINKFFSFMSYRQWQHMMDRLLETFFSDSQLGQYVAYGGKEHKIFKLLEKLGEAIYLIYLSKSKEHIAKHHPNDERVAHYYKESNIDEDNVEQTETELDEIPDSDA